MAGSGREVKANRIDNLWGESQEARFRRLPLNSFTTEDTKDH